MPRGKISNLVFNLSEKVIRENGLELINVEFVKEGPNQYLRLFIDREDGVTLDDCEKISKIISDILDKEDPIKKAYFLEVSSPGVN